MDIRVHCKDTLLMVEQTDEGDWGDVPIDLTLAEMQACQIRLHDLFDGLLDKVMMARWTLRGAE